MPYHSAMLVLPPEAFWFLVSFITGLHFKGIKIERPSRVRSDACPQVF